MRFHNASLSPIKVSMDILLVCLLWILSFYLRFYTYLSAEKGIPNWSLYIKLLPFIALIWTAVLHGMGVYSDHFRTPFLEAMAVLRACLIATLLFLAVTFFYEEYHYSRVTLALFACIHPIGLMGFRSLFRKYMRHHRKNIPPQQILILATGGRLQEVETFLQNLPQPWAVESVHSVGTAEEKKEAQIFCQTKKWPMRIEDNLERYFSQQYARSLIIALSHTQYQKLQTELETIWNQIPEVVVIPDLTIYQQVPSPIQYIQQVPAFFPHETALTGVGAIQKRMLDIAGSLAALLLFSPLMLLIVTLIKLTSRGPIFYLQERVGLDGNRFYMRKFRSMSVTAEKETGAVWARKNDARVTKIGKFLRATSLDELPQLLNVLQGDMSLVGPRPERAVFVDQFRTQIPQYMLRHKVKAGMTGWAQINGWRGSTDLQKRIECDLYYVKNWSLWFDCKILFFTIWKGFVHQNAY